MTDAAQPCYLTTFHHAFMLLNWPDLFFAPLLRNFAPERANNWMAQRRIRSRESARKHVCQLSYTHLITIHKSLLVYWGRVNNQTLT